MKRIFVAQSLALFALACGGIGPEQPQPLQPAQTIENTQPASLPVEEPPTVKEEVPLMIPKYATPQEIEQIRAQAKMKVELPFSPAIAIDPVDGSKVSIRSNTPVTEYKKKLYYFSSEANKHTFAASPEQYAKAQL
jgi:YHS domain-containing protein